MADSGRRVARHYELGAQLGAGRAGRVFAARDLRTGATVAVKLRSPGDDSRLDVESAGLRQLEHPNLLRVLDAGADGEGTFIVTELVNGGALDALAKPLSVDALQALSSQMLDALAFLHAHGILHGDIKTENVLVAGLTPPQFKLSDFGLAQRSVDIAAGTTRGSPAFMPPEIIRGEPADERSDLYSLGVTLYECAFGELPFDDGDLRTLLLRHLTELPTRLQDPGNVDPRLVALLRRLLAKDPASRPADARAALAVWRGDAAAAPRWVPPRLGVMIGCDVELARLEEAFESESAAIGIEGPSGLGKTRLLRELAIRLELRGVPVANWTPQGLRGVEWESDSGASEILETDLVNMDPRSLTESRAHEVLEQLGEPPWLLVVDDVDAAPNWFVEAVSNAIREVTSAGGKNRLIGVAGRETAITLVREALEAGGFSAPEGILFAPWPTATLEIAASALFGARRLHPNLVTLLDATTAGIPAEIEAACQQLAEKNLLRIDTQGALTVAAETTPQSILDPRSKRAAEQLARCAPEELQLLQILSILQFPTAVSFLEAFGPDVARSWTTLHRDGLVGVVQSATSTTVFLAHEGLRTAVVGTLSPHARRKLHDRIADILEHDATLGGHESPALHRASGSDLRMARKAVERMASTTEAEARPELLQRAYDALLELWPPTQDVRDRLEIIQASLDARLQLGLFEEVQRTASELVSSNQFDEQGLQAIRNRQAQALVFLGKFDSAIELVHDGARGLTGIESQLLRAQILSNWGKHSEVLTACDSIALDEIPADMASTVVDLRSTSLNALGHPGQAVELLRETIRSLEARGADRSVATLMLRLGVVEFYQGRMNDAESIMDRALSTCRSVGDRRGMLRALNNLAAVYGETGRNAKALEHLRSALDLCRRLGETDSLSYVLGNVAQMLLLQARYQEALENADESIAIGTSRNLVASTIQGRIGRGAILAALGLEDLCHTELEPIGEMVRGQGLEGQILLLWSDLALRRHDPAPVGSWLDRAREVLTAAGSDDELVRLDLHVARLAWITGDRERAIEIVETASSRSGDLNLFSQAIEANTLLSEYTIDASPGQAIEIAQSALETALKAGLRENVWRLHRILGRAAFLEGDYPRALAEYRACIHEIQDISESVPSQYLETYLENPERIRIFEESAIIGQGARN